MPPVYLEKVLRHAERELVHQSHLRPTDLLDIYRRFLKLEEHRLRLEHMHGEGGRDLCRKRADVITVKAEKGDRHVLGWQKKANSEAEKMPVPFFLLSLFSPFPVPFFILFSLPFFPSLFSLSH